MRILIIEDHALVRDGLIATLSSIESGIEIIGAGTMPEAFSALDEKDFDLITLDLMLPGTNGLSALPSLRRRFPSIPVLVVSATDDADTIYRVMSAGAAGFLAKSASAEVLIGAVRDVLNGDEYLSETHRQIASRTQSRQAPNGVVGRRYGLTDAQSRVLEFLAGGQSNRQIAQSLGLSEGTVKIHVSAILRAMNVNNRAEAALIANRKRRSS